MRFLESISALDDLPGDKEGEGPREGAAAADEDEDEDEDDQDFVAEEDGEDEEEEAQVSWSRATAGACHGARGAPDSCSRVGFL